MSDHYQEYKLEAFHVAKEINIVKVAEKLDQNLISKRREFLTYLLGSRQYLFVFSFGAIVFVNVAKDSQGAIKKPLSKFMVELHKKTYDESYMLQESEGKFVVEDNDASLPMVGLDEVEIAARVLAQSVALEYIEDLADEMFGNIGMMNSEVEKAGRFSRNAQAIIKLTAQNSNIIQFVISKLSLLDKPDITWERERLEMLFSQLADMFELRPRFRNIEYKIGFARDNAEFALSVLQHKRSNLLEIIVILLILFEIVLFIYDIYK